MRVVPVEIPGDIICGYGEREHPALCITFSHHFHEGLVEQLHLVLVFTIGGVLHLSADDHPLVSQVRWHLKVQGHIGKRCLEAYAGRYIDVEDEFLECLFDLGVIETVVTDKRRQQRVEI